MRGDTELFKLIAKWWSLVMSKASLQVHRNEILTWNHLKIKNIGCFNKTWVKLGEAPLKTSGPKQKKQKKRMKQLNLMIDLPPSFVATNLKQKIERERG